MIERISEISRHSRAGTRMLLSLAGDVRTTPVVNGEKSSDVTPNTPLATTLPGFA